MADRAEAVRMITDRATRIGAELGLERELTIAYRPRSRAAGSDELARELAERVEQDVSRGFTGHGPHRDELSMQLDARDLRAYGSQGQQRLGLLALLLAEREAIGEQRSGPPLMLLDDVMSELDHVRRRALIELLRGGGGQSVITTTDLEHVPGATGEGVARLSVAEGRVLEEVVV
jgi:DNA replication and repair protein RecF